MMLGELVSEDRFAKGSGAAITSKGTVAAKMC